MTRWFLVAFVSSALLVTLVAQAAQAWGIRLDVATVDKWTKQQQDQLREVVNRQLGGRSSFARYIRSQFGMSLDEHARWLRAKNVRALYQQYVVRYAALLYARDREPELSLERLGVPKGRC